MQASDKESSDLTTEAGACFTSISQLHSSLFHLTLAIIILVLSVATAIDAAGLLADTSPNWHLFILATAESIAAILFVIPLTTRLGGGVLIVILLFAFCVHALVGDLQLPLLVYIVGTMLVVVHGNAMGKPVSQATA
ncbi:MAG: hypothetical protein GY875_18855 [Gammaproteobacteria bacterium]|nr:hypothetical protein [Gammaproteobacteria bacterium]